MANKNKKPGRPVGSKTKSETATDKGPGVPPGAEGLAKLKTDKKAKKKAAEKKRTGGILDQAIEVLTDGISKSKPYFKLSADEKKQLSEANTAAADMAGLQFLNDPKYIILASYGLVFGPRLITLTVELLEKRKENIRSRNKRRAEPDNSGARKKGPGQDTADLSGIPPKNH